VPREVSASNQRSTRFIHELPHDTRHGPARRGQGAVVEAGAACLDDGRPFAGWYKAYN